MRPSQINKAARDLREVLTSENYLLENLHSLIDLEETITGRVTIMTAANGDSDIKQKWGDLMEPLKSVIAVARNLKAGQVFRAIHRIDEKLVTIESRLEPSPLVDAISAIRDALEGFDSAYEELVGLYSVTNAYKVARAADYLDAALLWGQKLSEALVLSFGDRQQPPSDDWGELSFYLPHGGNHAAVVRKLAAIRDLYSTLCDLLGISEEEYPLEISRLEVGSLWEKVFGHSKVMALMDDFLRGAAGYLYRTFTNEGKISGIPRKLESLDAALAFTKKLEAAGFDASQAREQLERAAAGVASELSSLLAGQPSIEVNGTEIGVGKELEQKYLEGSRGLLLGTGSDVPK